jgi:hypothetical protein
MATTSFSRRPAASAETPATETPKTETFSSPKDIPVAGGPSVNESTELAATKPAALSTNVSSSQGADVQGEVNLSDLRLPRLNLVQRTGDLPDRFDFGSFVINKEVSLGKTVEFIALSIKKQYQEKRPYGDTERGAIYDTAEQVREAGGSLGYADYQFSELAHIFLLVKMPEGLEDSPDAASVVDLFMYEIDGARYAPVIYSVGRSSYTSLAKALLTARQFMLRKGLWTGRWTMTSKVDKGPKGTWVTPLPTFKGKLSDEDAATADSIRRGE